MKDNKKLNVFMWVVSAVSVLLAILSTVFAFNSETDFAKVILITVALLFVALAGMVGYLAYVDTYKVIPGGKKEKKPLNYFLNANGRKKALKLEELTYEIIDTQMNNFVIDAWSTPVALWKNSVFSADDGQVFGKEGVFKILVAYKMISDLQAKHNKRIWKMFYELPDVDFADLQECLVRNGDDDLARNLNMYRLAGEASIDEAAAYLDSQADYMHKRVVAYVARKIELFEM